MVTVCVVLGCELEMDPGCNIIHDGIPEVVKLKQQIAPESSPSVDPFVTCSENPGTGRYCKVKNF